MTDKKLNNYFLVSTATPPPLSEKELLRLADEKDRKRQLVFFSILSYIAATATIGLLILLWPAISAAFAALPISVSNKTSLIILAVFLFSTAASGIGLMSVGLLKEYKRQSDILF